MIKYLKKINSLIAALEKQVKDLIILVEIHELKIKQLENNEVVDCKNIDWDSINFVKESLENNTIYKLAVINSGNKKVEYKSDFETWTTEKLTFPNTGNCENVWFRVEGCPQEIWGCVTTNHTNVNFITDKCK
jgi:hypothetical protein